MNDEMIQAKVCFVRASFICGKCEAPNVDLAVEYTMTSYDGDFYLSSICTMCQTENEVQL